MPKILKYFILIILLFSSYCSPNIASIQDKSISKDDFFSLLSTRSPEYFNKKKKFIESKLYNWKKLKIALITYLNQEAIWSELNNNKDFTLEIGNKQKRLFYLASLGEFVYKTNKSIIDLKKKKIESSALYFDKKALREELNRKDTARLDRIIIVLKYNDQESLSFSLDELKVLSNKEGDAFFDFISKNLVMRLRFAYFASKADESRPIFKRWWRLRWKKYLISLYENSIRKERRYFILAHKKDSLRKYYEDHKEQFLKYYKNSKDKYHFSYTSVEDDIVAIKEDEYMTKWRELLWKKYNIYINNDYFKDLELDKGYHN